MASCATAGPRGDDLRERRAGEDERGAVVRGPAVAQDALGDEPAVGRAALPLAVEVRARAAGEQAEPVVERGELLGRERVGDRLLEPAVHPGADAGEHHARVPSLDERAVEACLLYTSPSPRD